MRRLMTTLTVLFACLFGLPAGAAAITPAAPAPIGGGSILVNPLGSTANQCVVSFAAAGPVQDYLIAGAGCGAAPSTVLYSGNLPVGPVVGGVNGGYVVVAVTNTAAWDVVGWIESPVGRYPVGGSAETPVGGRVCLLSHSAGIQCGTVTAKNVTASFPGGVVRGLTTTDICPQPRGIVHVTGDQVQGVPVGGGSGVCTTGRSFFFPAGPILSAYGLTLITG